MVFSFSTPLFFRRAFTLVEVVITVAILGIVIGVAFPTIQGMSKDSLRISCLANQKEIRAAKDAYVLDHLGEGDPTTEERQAVFRSYFPEGFDDVLVCPLTGQQYADIYKVYKPSVCPVCGTDELGTGK